MVGTGALAEAAQGRVDLFGVTQMQPVAGFRVGQERLQNLAQGQFLAVVLCQLNSWFIYEIFAAPGAGS